MSPPPFFEHRQHRLADEIGVALRVVFVFGRDGVRAEERDGKIERTLIVEREQGFEQAQFGRGLQSVARFRFDGGCAVREHTQKTRARLRDQRFDGSHPRRADGGEDAAAFSQNLQVGLARHLHLELVGAVAAPNDVRVRVHEAGHQHASARVEGRLIGVGGFHFGCRPNRDDLFIAHHNRAVFDDAEVAEDMSALGTALQGEELGGGVDEHEELLVIGNW